MARVVIRAACLPYPPFLPCPRSSLLAPGGVTLNFLVAVDFTASNQHTSAPPFCPPPGGVNLNFLVAVDFTASNRDPRDPSSLHFLGQRTTQYEGGAGQEGKVRGRGTLLCTMGMRSQKQVWSSGQAACAARCLPAMRPSTEPAHA